MLTADHNDSDSCICFTVWVCNVYDLNAVTTTTAILNCYCDIGSQIVSPSGTVTIGTIGDYPLTYTAPNDLAGNPGQTITRLVLIRDLPPLSIVDDIATSPAGTLGSTITPTNPRHVDTFKIGTSTYAGVGGTNGLFIVDITDTESPEFVSRINGTGAQLNSVPFTTFVEIGDSTYALSVVSDFVPGTDREYFGRVLIRR